MHPLISALFLGSVESSIQPGIDAMKVQSQIWSFEET